MSKQLFTTNQGIRLNLSSSAISERMRRRIRAHKYECAELASIPKILQHRERVLEVGAGIGYVSAHAYNTGLVEHLTVIEANPYLVPVISETHNLNMVRSDIINGCLGKEGGVTNFYIHENFWSSSLTRPHLKNDVHEVVEIPVIPFAEIIKTVQPTLIICDIEGGEEFVFDDVDLSGVKKIFVECHQRKIGRHGMLRLFKTLHAQGFHYDQRHSKRSVVLFSHISRID